MNLREEDFLAHTLKRALDSMSRCATLPRREALPPSPDMTDMRLDARRSARAAACGNFKSAFDTLLLC